MKFRIIIGFLLSLVQTILAQVAPGNLTKHWSIRDGLSQGVVNSITQDDQSLMWFATEDGLNRFDGYSFKVFRYDPDAKTSIAENFVQSVFKDSHGTLWVSSRKGLLEFDPYQEAFYLYKQDFKNKKNYAFNDVSFITEGSANNLWVAWYGSGFASFDKEKKLFIPYTPETCAGLNGVKTVAVLEDGFGLLWVGTQEGGVNVFQVSKGEVVRKMNDLSDSSHFPSANVHCFAEDKYGNVWIGTSEGLVVYKRQENKFFTVDSNKFSTLGIKVFSLFADSNDNLWIGSQGEGLYQLDLRQLNTRPLDDFIIASVKNLSNNDISKRTIQCIYEDKDKNIWIGTFGEGTYFISSVKENFITIQRPIYKNTAVSFVPYYGMCYDRNGSLWFGTDGNGIYKSDLDGNTIHHFTVENSKGLKDNTILSALHDDKGRLWFGSYSQGLFLYNRTTESFTNYRYRDIRMRPGGHDVRVVFEDSRHNIWIGTNRGGLCLVNEKEKSYFNPPAFNGVLLEGDIRSITEDNTGNIWIGCYGDGVYKYSPSTGTFDRLFNNSNNGELIKSDIVFTVKSDRNGDIWIGTGGDGLYVFHVGEKQLRRYSEKDGLSNNTIYSVLIANNQNVWVSTNAGISKLDVSKNVFFNYDVFDGLQAGQFNPGSALYNEVGGYMCMGGTLGLNVFYPDQVRDNLKKPDIMLSGLSLFNKPVRINDSTEGNPVLKQVISRTKNILLKHNQNVLTFEFVGLNFSYPEKNIYAYKMEGFDEEWNYVGNQRSATYRYLKPGNYTFKVKASNIENFWSNDFASVSLEIKPPFWQTPLAYSIYILLASFISYGVFSFRKKQLSLRRRLKIEKSQRKHERQLVQQKLSFFTEISHEFKTPLTLMIGPLEEMLEKEVGVTSEGRKLRLVYRNAHKLLNLINKLLDYRKIESGNVLLKVTESNIVPFVEEVYIAFKELANHKNIKFNFHAELPVILLWFDKQKMEMVLNNIISNSFKYIGKGDEITIHVGKQITEKYPDGRVFIKIRDNGVGIPKKHLGNIFDWFYKGDNFGTMNSGIGLSLAKKLVHLHKGEIFVDSTEGTGSTFSIKIPLGKSHLKEDEVVLEIETDNFLPISDPESFTKNTTLHEHEEVAPSKKGLRSILLIEDDVEIRSFLREYFDKDYRVLESSNGKEGLDSALHNHPDLIISDIMMPQMDGISFCKMIKNNIRTSHIPVILLTAKTSLTQHKEGIETGADAYITKPFSPEILKLTVYNLLKSRESLMRFYRNLFTQDADNKTNQNANSIDEKFLHSVYELLKTNIENPDFNINELCDVLNMSRSLVYKKIKMLTGLSPVEYTRSLRMQEAAKLLKTKEYKVYEVAYKIGFNDIKYFRQCFAKEFGCSPTEFVKQLERKT